MSEMRTMTDRYEKIRKELSHEIWAAAQLAPGEAIVDGVARIEALLQQVLEVVVAGDQTAMTRIAELERNIAAKQARTDALVLEWWQDEMASY